MGKSQYPFRAIALTSGILSNLAGSTLIGIFFGRWIDQKLSTEPLFLIIGLFIGLASGVYATIYLVKKYTGEE
ncbi:F0F1-type ATP synthase assembly protein I [Salirhabdus euzebyi]|uniref:F0F1-type ATP synthase assembly protein I n=1 Tax=Salirhabdus euzebyi TaxID=394506 RepID=A0A841Q6E9_9BACI|nr:AtpZ/AtpI family protein [Salirhabdus euzebyi]MBB6453955.1 F0F1-type ATP synthase assembly protein I [Salirhabdus euzebyi]